MKASENSLGTVCAVGSVLRAESRVEGASVVAGTSILGRRPKVRFEEASTYSAARSFYYSAHVMSTAAIRPQLKDMYGGVDAMRSLDGKKVVNPPPLNASPGELRLWRKLNGMLSEDEKATDALEHNKAKSRANLAGRPRSSPAKRRPSEAGLVRRTTAKEAAFAAAVLCRVVACKAGQGDGARGGGASTLEHANARATGAATTGSSAGANRSRAGAASSRGLAAAEQWWSAAAAASKAEAAADARGAIGGRVGDGRGGGEGGGGCHRQEEYG